MTRVLISYRRQDTRAIAGRIFDRLEAAFGTNAVLMDIDSIPPGVDFHVWLRQQIATSSIVLALIGPHWTDARDASGQRRLSSPDDFVRIEIESALKDKIPLIPILIDGAPFPSVDQLPDPLKALTTLNAASVDAGRDFNVHVARLIEWIKQITSHPTASSRIPYGRSGSGILLRLPICPFG